MRHDHTVFQVVTGINACSKPGEAVILITISWLLIMQVITSIFPQWFVSDSKCVALLPGLLGVRVIFA